MEEPEFPSNEAIQVEKAKVLRAVRPLKSDDVVLGQYVGDPDADSHSDTRFGYRDDTGVPNDSKTPTFATIVLHIDNERWEGVPFILRCGKATNEVKDEVRLQFKSVSKKTASLFPQHKLLRNEIVIQLKPAERIIQRIIIKNSGLQSELENAEIDLSYGSKFAQSHAVGSFERVIESLLSNPSSAHYMGKEELFSSWELFDPLLKDLEKKAERELFQYEYGSLGPDQADKLCNKFNFNFSVSYPW